MKPKLLSTANHNIIVNLGYDCEVCFGTHMKLELSKKCGRQKKLAPIKVWFVGRYMGRVENLVIVGWSVGI